MIAQKQLTEHIAWKQNTWHLNRAALRRWHAWGRRIYVFEVDPSMAINGHLMAIDCY